MPLSAKPGLNRKPHCNRIWPRISSLASDNGKFGDPFATRRLIESAPRPPASGNCVRDNDGRLCAAISQLRHIPRRFFIRKTGNQKSSEIIPGLLMELFWLRLRRAMDWSCGGGHPGCRIARLPAGCRGCGSEALMWFRFLRFGRQDAAGYGRQDARRCNPAAHALAHWICFRDAKRTSCSWYLTHE